MNKKGLCTALFFVMVGGLLLLAPQGIWARGPGPRPSPTPTGGAAAAASANIATVCEFAGDRQAACEACFTRNPPEAWTAIGCIPTSPQGFIAKVLGLGIGLAGGLA